jgi:integrase
MARTVRDSNLQSRESRRGLETHPEPFWRGLEQGLHLGYRKRSGGGTWVARRRREKAPGEAGSPYEENRLGLADDLQDADGVAILSFHQAQAAARKWWKEAKRREAGHVTHEGPYTVQNAIDDYLEAYKAGHTKGGGRAFKATEAAINAHIVPSLGSTQVSKLTAKAIREWQNKLAETPARVRAKKGKGIKHRKQAGKADPDAERKRKATANRILGTLKAVLNHAWKEGYADTDEPWRRVKPFHKVGEAVIRYLTAAECNRLVNACPKDFRALARAAILTGCRYGELIALKAGDYNPDAGTLAIRASKSGKARHVVLTDEGQEFFEQAILNKAHNALLLTRADGGHWGKSHQQRPLADACKAAKIKPAISFHVLRHTHGTLLAMRGTPMQVIAKQLGHSDTRMTEKHYAHFAPDYVADTIREKMPTLGIVEPSNVQPVGKRKGKR